MSEVKILDYDKKNLSKNDLEVIDILCDVGREIHKIWEKQVNPDTNEAYFYPKDVTAEDLKKAGKLDESILDPYTVVYRDSNGALKARKYIDEYSEEIKNVCKLLEKAANLTEDADTKEHLLSQSKCFSEGDFKGALIDFLTNKNSKIEVLMGPIETYLDKTLGIKKAFQFNLRVFVDNETRESKQIVDVIKYLQIVKPRKSIAAKIEPNNVKIRVDEVVMFAGRQASTNPSSTNLPNEYKMVEKYGVKVIVYKNSLNTKFDKMIAPYLSIFDDEINTTNIDKMRVANFRMIVLHEVTESIVKFPRVKERLQAYGDALRELNADITGVKSANYHVLSGLITNGEYTDLLIAFLAFAIQLCKEFNEEPSLLEYARGYAVMFNYLFEIGALTITEGNKLSLNWTRLAGGIDVLSNILLSLLEEGTVGDAEKLFSEYGSFDIFDKIPVV